MKLDLEPETYKNESTIAGGRWSLSVAIPLPASPTREVRQEVKVLLFLAFMLSKCPNLCDYGYIKSSFSMNTNRSLTS